MNNRTISRPRRHTDSETHDIPFSLLPLKIDQSCFFIKPQNNCHKMKYRHRVGKKALKVTDCLIKAHIRYNDALSS